MLVGNFLSDGPASIKATFNSGIADRRLAITDPADPEPITI
jgi:hypothetical protein